MSRCTLSPPQLIHIIKILRAATPIMSEVFTFVSSLANKNTLPNARTRWQVNKTKQKNKTRRKYYTAKDKLADDRFEKLGRGEDEFRDNSSRHV